MKTSSLLASLSVAVLGVGSAQAATLTFTIENKTTSTITSTFPNACSSVIPALSSVAANGISPVHQTDCGNNTAVAFDYTNGTKTCGFNLSSIYTPPNPLLGTSGYWTPKGTGTSKKGSAVCKATLISLGSNGSYGWALSIQ
ncbi:hypothetical protein [Stigmatella aurantiaca]|uniref:GP80, putative n=1 Tax=Stigmatella aurantiaca (strain DW4/3-1) TaxID=378806 RepID=Q098X7_STIAD|nr:hypothetical protein [Stigmatella aurantiaca]ADO75475.1 uncharacterized protein STAUR_7720 [Stigmatella aurantiaca DW4/3-1]EAU68319.1 GP80, putative [Stigmatella aurantiaca DW4/3-1]